jgi:rhodanese-related sulfurtransferase
VAGVELVTEFELFEFMENRVNTHQGLIIDARLPDWYLRGTIPGSVNIPFTIFQRDPTDAKFKRAFEMLGVRPRGPVGTFTRITDQVLGSGDKTELWDFSAAKELVLWCNGPWCGQSPHAIRALVKQGYPAKKIHYYRGGMQMWQILGLTTVVPDESSVLFADASGE